MIDKVGSEDVSPVKPVSCCALIGHFVSEIRPF